tara:strand:- start:801 stop:2528 length:1728 start_codon:yes stop_codon:yes gene_type:complete
MDFPSTNLVAGTTTHTVGNNTWTWNGYAWTKDCCGYGPTGPTGPTGPVGPTGPTGPTGSAMGPNPYTTVAGALDAVGTGVVKAADSSIQVHKFDRASKDMRHYWDDAGDHGNLFIVDEETPEQYILFNYTSTPTYSGTYYTFAGETRVSVGNWNAGDAGTPVRKCRIFYIPNAVTSFNGLRGAVDTTSLDLPVKGLSANAGATFADEVIFLSGISCNNGITFGGNIYGTAGSRIGLAGGPNFRFDSPGGKVELLGGEFLDINQYLRHQGNEGTNIRFDGDDIYLKSTNYNNVIKAHKDLCTTYPLGHFIGGISADHGATFAGEVDFLSGISCEKGITAENLSLHGPLTATTIGGTVITASSYFSGTLIGNATNSLACSGNATTSTSTTNITISASSTDSDLSVPLVDNLGGGSTNSLVKVDSGAGNNGFRYNPGTDLLTLGGVSAGHGATFGGAVNLSSSGVRFSDGTTQTTATVTGSYTGQIETAADKTYTLDPKVATARTVTGFYIKSASGTVTATLKNGSDTIKAASVSDSSGDQTSLANTSVSADAVLTIVTSSNSSALDVIFNVEYTTEI